MTNERRRSAPAPLPAFAQATPALGAAGRAARRREQSSRLTAQAVRGWSRFGADGAAVVGILALSFFVFWSRVRLDSGYFNGDILTQFIPLYTEVASRLKDGDLPGWNPALFSGMPLAGDPISGWGYLPAMGFFTLFGPLEAYQAHVLFHLALAGVATFFLGRRLGMGVLGALVAAVAYELGPHAYFTKCCTARMQLGPWIPLGLLAVELGVRCRSWTGRVLCWGAAGAVISQVIAGYFGKGAYYGILTIGAYAAYRTLLDPPESSGLRRRIVGGAMHCGAILGLGFALSAVTVLPRLDFMERANLEGGSYEAVAPNVATATGWSVGRAFTNILNAADPKYYVGAATFALAIAGIVLAGRYFAAPFFALFSAGILILTLEHTPLHTLAYLLPRFEVIHEHVPARILVVFNIGPAMLAGAAVTAIQRSRAGPARVAVSAIAVFGAVAAVAVVAERDGVHFDGDVRRTALTVGAILAGAALLGMLARRWPLVSASRLPAVVAGLLLLAVAWNLGSPAVDRVRAQGFGLPPIAAVPLAYTDRDDSGQAGAYLAEATEAEPGRYLGYDAAFLNGQSRDSTYYHAFEDDLRTEALLVNNRAVLLHLQDAQGYNPVHSMRYVEFVDAMNGATQEYHETNLLRTGIGSPLLDMLNVRYIVVPAAVPPGRPDLLRLSQRYPTVFATTEVRVLENYGALPRAWIVHGAQQVGEGEALPLLASGAVDPRRVALIETHVPQLGQPDAAVADTVRVTAYEPDRITLSASTSAAGLLILSEIYDPGWHAYVDGERVPVSIADHILRAVPLSAGVHEVELRYEPRTLRIGLGITTVTAGVLVAVALYAVPRPKSRRPSAHWRRRPPMRMGLPS